MWMKLLVHIITVANNVYNMPVQYNTIRTIILYYHTSITRDRHLTLVLRSAFTLQRNRS